MIKKKNSIRFFLFFLSLGHCLLVESFRFNIDILTINPIDLSVVLGVLTFFSETKCVPVVYFKNWPDKTECTFIIITSIK